MLSVDTIFFDIDGTLVDARADIAKAMNYALAKLGFSQKPQDEIVSYIGTGVTDLIRKSLDDKADEFIVENALKLYSDYYTSHSHDQATLYPHVKETLEHFKNKQNFILTNRYGTLAEATLKGLGIRKYFVEIIGGDDENCLKPSACVLDPVLTRLNIDKDRSIIVGDMNIDVMTGKNSGIKTCWVTYGLGKAEDVKLLKPDYIIDDLIKLKEIIN